MNVDSSYSPPTTPPVDKGSFAKGLETVLNGLETLRQSLQSISNSTRSLISRAVEALQKPSDGMPATNAFANVRGISFKRTSEFQGSTDVVIPESANREATLDAWALKRDAMALELAGRRNEAPETFTQPYFMAGQPEGQIPYKDSPGQVDPISRVRLESTSSMSSWSESGSTSSSLQFDDPLANNDVDADFSAPCLTPEDKAFVAENLEEAPYDLSQPSGDSPLFSNFAPLPSIHMSMHTIPEDDENDAVLPDALTESTLFLRADTASTASWRSEPTSSDDEMAASDSESVLDELAVDVPDDDDAETRRIAEKFSRATAAANHFDTTVRDLRQTFRTPDLPMQWSGRHVLI